MKLQPNAQSVGCAFPTFAANGQSRQRSACRTSEFVEQLSLELRIVDSGMRLNAALTMPIPSASKRFRILRVGQVDRASLHLRRSIIELDHGWERLFTQGRRTFRTIYFVAVARSPRDLSAPPYP
jgi:hypothetical protein